MDVGFLEGGGYDGLPFDDEMDGQYVIWGQMN